MLCFNFVLADLGSEPALKEEHPIQEAFQSELVYPQDEGEVQFTLSAIR